MKNLQITANFIIHNGQLEAFKEVAEECMSIVTEKDHDTLQYDWYFNQDQTESFVRETYKDSNALLAHIDNLGDTFGKLLAVSDFSVEIYGNPSDELMNEIEGANVKVYPYFQGL